MEQKIKLKYYNPRLNIGMASIRQVYLLSPILIDLQAEVYRGKLVYRQKGSSKRISYDQVKQGLVQKDFTVSVEVPNWLFK